MCKLLGNRGKFLTALFPAIIFLLLSAANCKAQNCVSPYAYANDPTVYWYTPTITSVSPSTWVAGQTYNITIVGTGLVNPPDLPNWNFCSLNVTLTNAGSVTLSNVIFVSATLVTATVTPDASDPTQTACVTVGGQVLMVVRQAVSTNAAASADECPANAVNTASAAVQIEAIQVQAQNVTPGLNLQPEHAGIDPSAPPTAHLTLGGTFQLALASQDTSGAFQPLPSTYKLGTSSLTGDLDSKALYPKDAVFKYSKEVKSAAVLQAVHLGKQKLTITPNDTSFDPVTISLSVEDPASLGGSHPEFDSGLYSLADDTGVPPQMIKGQIATEATNFDPMTWRYEPFNGDVGDFAFSTLPKDLRAQAPYNSLILPTIGDSVAPGNCRNARAPYATMGNVKVIVNGEPSNGVSSLSPPSGAPGTQVTISGTNFGTSQKAVLVTVNGVNAVITSWSSTSITALVPTYDYAEHVNSRIVDPACSGFAQGTSFSQQVMDDIAQTHHKTIIPQRDPKTGAILKHQNGNPLTRTLSGSDRYVSARDIYEFNNGYYHWKKDALKSAVSQLTSGEVAFTAQLSLAASYGLLQVTYIKALEEKWPGNRSSCGPASLTDPDNLFDTTCNLQSGGGSLRIGTRITDENFAGAGSRSPSVNDEPTLETRFLSAYQKYNKNKTGYGKDVISNTQSFEPNPNGTIFNAGGQQ